VTGPFCVQETEPVPGRTDGPVALWSLPAVEEHYRPRTKLTRMREGAWKNGIV
jgi:hypothetical protein